MTDIINISPDRTVQIIFEIQNDELTYRDALYFNEDEYNALSATDIENMKTARYDAWISMITPVNSN